MIPLARFAVPCCPWRWSSRARHRRVEPGAAGHQAVRQPRRRPRRRPRGTCPTTPPPQGTPEGWDVASQHPSVFPEIINPPGTIACGANRLVFSFLDAKNVPIAKPDRTVDAQRLRPRRGPEDAGRRGHCAVHLGHRADRSASTFSTSTSRRPAPTASSSRRRRPAGSPEDRSGPGSTSSRHLAWSRWATRPRRPTRPTLADVGGESAKISTDPSPVKAFYKTSIADAVAAQKPFVVAFATPKFCVVEAVRADARPPEADRSETPGRDVHQRRAVRARVQGRPTPARPDR